MYNNNNITLKYIVHNCLVKIHKGNILRVIIFSVAALKLIYNIFIMTNKRVSECQ